MAGEAFNRTDALLEEISLELASKTEPANPQTVTGTVTANGAAGTNRIGGTYEVGGQLIDEVPTVRTINRAFVNATASGNTEVVAAQAAGIRIRVLAYAIISPAALNVKFQSATTDISATMPFDANGGMVTPETPHGWFQTAAAEALNINLSGAAAAPGVAVQIIWVQAT